MILGKDDNGLDQDGSMEIRNVGSIAWDCEKEPNRGLNDFSQAFDISNKMNGCPIY